MAGLLKVKRYSGVEHQAHVNALLEWLADPEYHTALRRHENPSTAAITEEFATRGISNTSVVVGYGDKCNRAFTKLRPRIY